MRKIKGICGPRHCVCLRHTKWHPCCAQNKNAGIYMKLMGKGWETVAAMKSVAKRAGGAGNCHQWMDVLSMEGAAETKRLGKV